MISLQKLTRNPKNVKAHTTEQIHDLAELIKMVGFKDPLVIDRSNVVWAGHGRLEAAILLGLVDVPCIYADGLDEDQKAVFMLMDNKVNESNWIAENVKLVFDQTDPAHFDQFDMTFDINPMDFKTAEEWTGMPEFDQPNEDIFQTIIVRFDTREDVEKFSKLIGQTISDKTQSLRIPYREKPDTKEQYES